MERRVVRADGVGRDGCEVRGGGAVVMVVVLDIVEVDEDIVAIKCDCGK